jgi:hypothetical protein
LDKEMASFRATFGPSDHRAEESKFYWSDVKLSRLSLTVVGLPWPADSCPWVGKLRTVLPITVVIRDGAVQLVLPHQRART